MLLAPERNIRDLGERGAVITRFVGRSYTEPSELFRRLIQEQFGELGSRFHQALCRAAPVVPPDELFWRLMAVVAVITYILAVPAEEGGLLDPDDVDGTEQRMISFLGPGLRAPAPRRRRSAQAHFTGEVGLLPLIAISNWVQPVSCSRRR